MDTIKILGSPLYQWEVGRKIQITPFRDLRVSMVHFSNAGDTEALVVKPVVNENGTITVDIPNILMQDKRNIVLYVVDVSADCVETLRECILPVRPRPRPADYVYTETEVLNYSSLDKRIGQLEGEGLSKAVADYLKENPVEAVETFVVTAVKDTEHNETRIDKTNADILAAHENGETVVCHLHYDEMQFMLQPVLIGFGVAAFACLMQNASAGVMLRNDVLEITVMEFTTTEDLNATVNTALEQAKESGLFDGKPGADGQDGKDGYTPVKGVDYFDGKDGQDGQNGMDGVDGQPGKDGETPVRGVDYWTDADKAEIKSYVDTAILGGAW